MFCLTELLGRNSEVEGSLGIIHFNFYKETSAHLYQEDHFQPHFMLFHFPCHIPHCFWRRMCFSFFPKTWILVYLPYFIQSWRKVQRATKWVENKVTLILTDTPNWENMKKIWKDNWPAVKADLFSNLKLALSVRCCISCGNQSFDLDSRWNDWFPYEMQYWAETG